MELTIERNRFCNPAKLKRPWISVDDRNVTLRDCLVVLGGGMDWELGMRAGEAVGLECGLRSGSLYLVSPKTWYQKLALRLLFRGSRG